MNIIFYIACVLTAALSFFGLAFRFIIKSHQSRIIFGMLFLSLDAGLILGLSTSPVISAVLAALFTLAGTILPIVLSKELSPAFTQSDELKSWIAPLGPGLFLGLLVGIFVRANDVLVMKHEDKVDNLRVRLDRMGFDKDQADRIMSRLSGTIMLKEPLPINTEAEGQAAENKPVRLGGLLASSSKASLQSVVEEGLSIVGTDDQKIEHIRKSCPPDILPLLDAFLEKHNTISDKVLSLRKAYPRFQEK